MTTSTNRLFRSRDGVLLGVCKGIAQYRDIPVTAVRIAFIVFTLLTAFYIGIGLYILAALLMEPEPALQPQNLQESDFYRRFCQSRTSALQELREKMQRLDIRLRTMEDKVTRSTFDWDQRFRR